MTWTRDHARVQLAWVRLCAAHIRRELRPLPNFRHWFGVRFSVFDIFGLYLLTRAQCRHAARQLNAWRAALEGRA